MIIKNLETLDVIHIKLGSDTLKNFKWFVDNICTIENMYDYFDSIDIELENMCDFKQAKYICAKYEELRIRYKVLESGVPSCKDIDKVYYFASTEGNCIYEWLHRAMEKYMCVGKLHKAD